MLSCPTRAVLSAVTIASTGEGRPPDLPEVRGAEYLPTSSSPVQREEPHSYIEPGHSWENPFIESFNDKLRDELLNVEAFETLFEAKVLAEDFQIDYNTYRPHSSLGYRSPATFAAEWAQQPDGVT